MPAPSYSMRGLLPPAQEPAPSEENVHANEPEEKNLIVIAVQCSRKARASLWTMYAKCLGLALYKMHKTKRVGVQWLYS